MRRVALLVLLAAPGVVAGKQPPPLPDPPAPISHLTPDPTFTLAAAGDVLLGRYIEKKSKYSIVPRVDDPFADVAPFLRAADLAFCNVESPVVDEPAENFSVFKTMTFRANPSWMPVLAAAGFDVLSLANNHIFNMKEKAVPESRAHVEAAGMMAVGAGANFDEAMKPVIFQVGKTRVAFLAYTIWLNSGKGVRKHGAVAFFQPEKELIKAAIPAIRAARRYLGADFVLVSVHWGKEYVDNANGGQRLIARTLVDNGADMILGHHPHVVQDFEWRRGALIIYSMGNFVFDQPGLDRRQTLLVNATLTGVGPTRHVSAVELVPLLIDKDRAPRLVKGKAYKTWTKRLAKLAGKLIPIRAEPAADDPGVDDVKPMDSR